MPLDHVATTRRSSAPRRWAWLGVFAALAVTAALAAPGDLDLTFDGDGKVTTGIGSGNDFGFSLVLQPDGKIVVGGSNYAGGLDYQFALARYNPDGSLDTSFDGDGKVLTNFNALADQGVSVALQADGKILLGGGSSNGGNNDFALARYHADGTLDTSFDGDGMLTTDLGPNDLGRSVAVQADGKILLGGQSYNGSNDDIALVRYNANGTLDTSFDGDGKVFLAMGGGNDVAYSVAMQTDGKILVGGFSHNGSNSDFAAARFNSNGTLDTSFSGDGWLTTPIGVASDVAQSVKVQGDGKILLGGYAIVGTTGDFAVARYHANGTLDTSFDGDGKLTTPIGAADDRGLSMAVQANGKILLAGYGGTRRFALARYLADGTLDTSLDGDGKLTTVFGNIDDVANSVAVQADGKIVLGGSRYDGSQYDFALARYGGDPVDSAPPSCRVGAVVTSGGTVYVPVTVSDSGTGVASVQLTTSSSNCKLEWDSPTGLVTAPIGGVIVIDPPAASTVVRAVKLNSSLKARVELRVTDAAGNFVVCDPVIANLKLKQGRTVVRTFKGIPEHEHYVKLENGTPGLTAAKLWVNGRLVSTGSLTDGQVVALDIEHWMRPGRNNTVRIAATGPKQASAVLLIGDASLAGGAGSHSAPAVRGGRETNFEFSR